MNSDSSGGTAIGLRLVFWKSIFGRSPALNVDVHGSGANTYMAQGQSVGTLSPVPSA